jgi:hypothetical protein
MYSPEEVVFVQVKLVAVRALMERAGVPEETQAKIFELICEMLNRGDEWPEEIEVEDGEHTH